MKLFQADRPGLMFLFCSHGVKPVNPPFQAGLDPDSGEFRVLRGLGRQWRDGGVVVLPRRCTTLQRRRQQAHTSEEVRRIGKASRIPEFMMQRRGFHPTRERTLSCRPVGYIRERWDETYRLCQVNSLPFNATGETIQDDGVWRVYEFAGRWTPSCSGIAFRAAGYAGRSFTTPSVRPIFHP